MSNAIKITGLTAVITHKRNDKKKIVASNVLIALPGLTGNIGVAFATIGGNYNAEQALKEFKTNQKRFALIDNGFNMAKAMKLV